jgi:hypothetical protein
VLVAPPPAVVAAVVGATAVVGAASVVGATATVAEVVSLGALFAAVVIGPAEDPAVPEGLVVPADVVAPDDAAVGAPGLVVAAMAPDEAFEVADEVPILLVVFVVASLFGCDKFAAAVALVASTLVLDNWVVGLLVVLLLLPRVMLNSIIRAVLRVVALVV